MPANRTLHLVNAAHRGILRLRRGKLGWGFRGMLASPI